MSAAVLSDFERAMRVTSSVPIPLGTHWSWVTGPTVRAGYRSRLVVWADRAGGTLCSGCRQVLNRRVRLSPVRINDLCTSTGDELALAYANHSCRTPMPVEWEAVHGTGKGGRLTKADVAQALSRMAQWLDEATEAQAESVYVELKNTLRTAMVELTRPLTIEETREERAAKITTGTATYPGLWCTGVGVWAKNDPRWCDPKSWEAWTFAPDGSGETLTAVFANLEDGD